MKSVWIGLLVISLSVNAYLWWKINAQQSSITQTLPLLKKLPTASQQSARASSASNNNAQDANTNSVGFEQRSEIPSVPEEGVTLAFLRNLKSAKQFEALSFHVRTYLRANPQDIDALLLEAEAYYYTQPLNSALVNYYGLRDALLTDAQLEQINQLIDVNTTRIIQQFSGDGSWDLLASFLEPLVQVDPLNRRYLLALAKAYGMQQQTVLMENVLASLPINDPRAQRLRESIYESTESEQAPELTRNQQNFDRFDKMQQGEVYLVERNGQYYTRASLSNIEAQLLIDTGASTTAISQHVFDQISVKDTAYLGTFNVQTAGGNISSPIYRISTMEIGSTIMSNVSVMVLPTENMREFDGLLGMNVIKRFNITYDQSVGSMRMYTK